MRYPIARIRPLEDDEVDRAEVEVQQCIKLTVTNRSKVWSTCASFGCAMV